MVAGCCYGQRRPVIITTHVIPRRVSSGLAAALDSTEPTGKSAGFGPKFLSGRPSLSCESIISLRLLVYCPALRVRFLRFRGTKPARFRLGHTFPVPLASCGQIVSSV